MKKVVDCVGCVEIIKVTCRALGRKNKEQSTTAAAAAERRLSAQHRIIKRNGEELNFDGPQPSIAEELILLWARRYFSREMNIFVYGGAGLIKTFKSGV